MFVLTKLNEKKKKMQSKRAQQQEQLQQESSLSSSANKSSSSSNNTTYFEQHLQQKSRPYSHSLTDSSECSSAAPADKDAREENLRTSKLGCENVERATKELAILLALEEESNQPSSPSKLDEESRDDEDDDDEDSESYKSTMNIISSKWVKAWLKFSCHPRQHSPPLSIDNSSLVELCRKGSCMLVPRRKQRTKVKAKTNQLNNSSSSSDSRKSSKSSAINESVADKEEEDEDEIDLICDNNDHAGDYRIINRKTWNAFVSMYGNNGPVIRVDTARQDEGVAPWYIDQELLHSFLSREMKLVDEQLSYKNAVVKGCSMEFGHEALGIDSASAESFLAEGTQLQLEEERIMRERLDGSSPAPQSLSSTNESLSTFTDSPASQNSSVSKATATAARSVTPTRVLGSQQQRQQQQLEKEVGGKYFFSYDNDDEHADANEGQKHQDQHQHQSRPPVFKGQQRGGKERGKGTGEISPLRSSSPHHSAATNTGTPQFNFTPSPKSSSRSQVSRERE
jgi:hypothetical protein